MKNDEIEKEVVPRKVKLAGIDAEVVSEQECLKADMAVAMPTYWHQKTVAAGGYEIPGTKAGFPCKLCGQDCVLAPSGQRLNAMGLQYTCMDCAMKFIKGE